MFLQEKISDVFNIDLLDLLIHVFNMEMMHYIQFENTYKVKPVIN